MQNKRILFLSNGLGEDAIAAGIIQALAKSAPFLEILALPLVGEGAAYRPLGVQVLGGRPMLPSGGLVPADWRNLLRDIRGGLGALTLSQLRLLGSLHQRVDGAICVGDAYPVILAAFFLRRPIIFVGTAKSNYFCPYSILERWLFRTHCQLVLTRDKPTARTLRFKGISSQWVGNAMMDSLEFSDAELGVSRDRPWVGILPGSREATYRDLPLILQTVEILDREEPAPFHYLAALADSTDLERLGRAAARAGWSLKSQAESPPGVVGELVRRGRAGAESRIVLTRGRFGDVIKGSTLVLGQAGTGNEQAAGLGKPVVAFDAKAGERLGWYRGRQQGLLGDALSVVPADPSLIAAELLAIWKDEERYREMADIGHMRMGPPGGAAKMAELILFRWYDTFEPQPMPENGDRQPISKA